MHQGSKTGPKSLLGWHEGSQIQSLESYQFKGQVQDDHDPGQYPDGKDGNYRLISLFSPW